MRIGPLRHRVVLQGLVQGQDCHGGVTETWTDREQAWASFEAMSGREWFESKQAQSEATHRVRIRYRAGVRSLTWRLVHEGTVYGIAAVLPDGRLRSLVLMCREESHAQA